MRSLTIISFIAVLIAVVWARPQDTYTDQFDNVDVDEILKSERLLASYVVCLKTGTKCTPDGQKLRDLLPDALQTRCSKCSELQKKQIRKVFQFLIKDKYPTFRELEEIFDPEHKYRTDYADDLKKEGIDLPAL